MRQNLEKKCDIFWRTHMESALVTANMLLGLAFVVMLMVEWRYRLRAVRVAAAVLALVVLYIAQPGAHSAARRALEMPPAERITQIPYHSPLTDYESGVFTMERAVVEDSDVGEPARLLAIGVLAWLACSPAFKRERTLPIAESSVGPASPINSGN
jgi:hypothetical protein